MEGEMTSKILSGDDNLNFIYECLLASDKSLTEVLLWLLGNIIIDCEKVREYVVKNDFFEFLAGKLDDFLVQDETKEKIAWLLSNFFRNIHYEYCKINVKL
jgi:hypothetical protein